MEFPLYGDHELSTIGDLKTSVAEKASTPTTRTSIEPGTIKLLYKGKVLSNNEANVMDIFVVKPPSGSTTKKQQAPQVFRVMATGGMTQTESEIMDRELQDGIQKAKSLVRDDLTTEGQRRMRQRQTLGRKMMKEAQLRQNANSSLSTSSYGFGTIETLPNLPDESKAREILESLANDPGIKACMAKHKWFVPSLAEMYPEGKVGESEVCVMGLNRNKGQQILLRIRTDDLKGFRKILSIREVLYHELSHNVHSEHDTKFFQLMRQIKRECLEMDWTKGHGTTQVIEEAESEAEIGGAFPNSMVTGGTYRLGGEDASASSNNENPKSSVRDLARNAALNRLQTDQRTHQVVPPEITFHCGHGQYWCVWSPTWRRDTPRDYVRPQVMRRSRT